MYVAREDALHRARCWVRTRRGGHGRDEDGEEERLPGCGSLRGERRGAGVDERHSVAKIIL